MKEDKVTLHANAINLARRWSEMNENDLVMVRFRMRTKTLMIEVTSTKSNTAGNNSLAVLRKSI